MTTGSPLRSERGLQLSNPCTAERLHVLRFRGHLHARTVSFLRSPTCVCVSDDLAVELLETAPQGAHLPSAALLCALLESRQHFLKVRLNILAHVLSKNKHAYVVEHTCAQEDKQTPSRY